MADTTNTVPIDQVQAACRKHSTGGRLGTRHRSTLSILADKPALLTDARQLAKQWGELPESETTAFDPQLEGQRSLLQLYAGGFYTPFLKDFSIETPETYLHHPVFNDVDEYRSCCIELVRSENDSKLETFLKQVDTTAESVDDDLSGFVQILDSAADSDALGLVEPHLLTPEYRVQILSKAARTAAQSDIPAPSDRSTRTDRLNRLADPQSTIATQIRGLYRLGDRLTTGTYGALPSLPCLSALGALVSDLTF